MCLNPTWQHTDSLRFSNAGYSDFSNKLSFLVSETGTSCIFWGVAYEIPMFAQQTVAIKHTSM